MLNFLVDSGNYASRKVGRDNFEWGFVSTAKVSDGTHPYETAVEHNKYGDGKMVIVAAYDTRAEAEAGHAAWVATMTTEPLPPVLRDCCNSGISQVCRAFGESLDKEYNA